MRGRHPGCALIAAGGNGTVVNEGVDMVKYGKNGVVPMLRRCSISVLLVAVIVGLSGCGGAGVGQTSTSPTSTVGMMSQTKNIVTGTIVVPASGSRDLTFSIDGMTQRNIRLVGWFHASGGSQNEIEVFVSDDTDYQSWQQGRKVTPLYNSGRTTLADLNVKIPSSTVRYHLVFNNVFSTSLKTIEAQIDLQYYVPVSPTPAP